MQSQVVPEDVDKQAYMVKQIKELKARVHEYQKTQLPNPYGEQKLIEEMLTLKNQHLDGIRQRCVNDPEFDEILDAFNQQEFNNGILLKVLDRNE